MRKVMGYRLGVIGLVGFLCFLLTAHAAEQKAAGPDHFKEEVPEAFFWDFGKVKEGTILKHNFIFKNESKKTLTIAGVITSCGCTVSEIKKNKLLPQESTLLKVRFNTKGYSGPVQQNIFVTTDDLDRLIVRFIIKAEVMKGVT